MSSQVAAAAGFQALLDQGLALRQAGRLVEALAACERAAALAPAEVDGHNLSGVLLRELGRPEAALAAFDRALRLQPGFPGAHFNRAQALRDLERPQEALADYDRVIAAAPDFAAAHNGRGMALHALERFDEAIAAFETALALSPDFADARYNLGVALRKAWRPAEALAAFGAALALAPGAADAYANRAGVLVQLMRLEEAEASFATALRLYAQARGARATAAFLDYDPALQVHKDYAGALWTSGFVHLLQGRLDIGWRHYEWRKHNWGEDAPHFDPARLWRGGPSLQGKTLFLYFEQGLGDTLQFCRYVFALQPLGARIVLRVQDPLKGFLRQLHPAATVIGEDDPTPAFDYHCPLLSLPLALGTTLNSVPGPARYLSAEPERRAAFEALLGPRTKLRVGIAWSGNPDHENDRNRSIAFERLAPLLTDEIEWRALQTGVRASDAAAVAAGPVRLCGDLLKDFSDTAALVDLMDLVVTVDTSVAHLAGAMGKPVWLLLPFSPDWRWMAGCSDTPWYPSVRLFRQPAIGDWESVLARVSSELRAVFH